MNNSQKPIFYRIMGSFCESNKLLMNNGKIFIFSTFSVMFLLGIIPAFSTIVMQRIINSLQLGETYFNYYILLIGIYICLDIIEAIINSCYSIYYSKFSANFDKEIRIKLLEKAAQLKLEDYEDHNIYNTINRAKSQTGGSILSFYSSFATIFKTIVKISSSIIILSKYNLILILAILIIPIAKYLYSIKVGQLQYDIQVKRTDKERKVWYIDHIIMTGQAYKELKLFNIFGYLIEMYKTLKEKFITEDMKILKRSFIVQLILQIVDSMISGIIFASIVLSGLSGLILIGDVVTYTKCVFSIKADTESIFSIISTTVKNSLFISLLYEFLNLDIQNDCENKNDIKEIKSLEFRAVSYKYKNSSDYCLKNINFKIDKNCKIGVVGKNGAGKSTLIKLLLGFYNDYKGEIFINGIELRELNHNSYYKRIGSVFQDYVKYECSLRENVAFGNLDNINNDKAIIESLNSVNLNPEIYKKDINIVLGNWFGTKQLSLGEWQRVAIARAFIKNADLYILDEPDASLDVMAEIEMLSYYKKILKNKMGFFVTHKVNQIHMLADYILVMDNGEIVQSGNHEDLLKYGGVYKELYDQQRKQSIE